MTPLGVADLDLLNGLDELGGGKFANVLEGDVADQIAGEAWRDARGSTLR